MHPYFTNYRDQSPADAFECAVLDAEQGDALEIQKDGKRVAVLIGVEEYEALTEAYDRLNAHQQEGRIRGF